MEDVVYLKNESIFRGKITFSDNGRVKLQTGDGMILVFNKDKITKI